MGARQVYASHVLALQQLLTARLGREVRLPFLVMTSDDTHARIGALLQQHAHYGLAPSQVRRRFRSRRSHPDPTP